MISKIGLLSATAASVQAVTSKGKCPFGYTSSEPQSEELMEVKQNGPAPQFPSQILTCPTARAGITAQFSAQEYEELAGQIIQQQFASTDPAHPAKFAACLLRLEGHDLMDFRRKTRTNRRGITRITKKKAYGGSDGCVNFEDGDNAGLPQCLAWSGINEIYGQWCHQLSLADFMVLAAEASIGSLAEGFDAAAPFAAGTLLARLRDRFKFGRETLEECPENVHMMPNPENGCDDLQAIFIDHIYRGAGHKGKRWNHVAALSGAHTIGQAQPENSGYDGLWGDPANQAIFNNVYFKNIMAHGWGPQRSVGGNPDRNQWKLIDSSDAVEKGRQMMLNSDMCLFYQYNTLHADCMRGNRRIIKMCKQERRKGGFLNVKDATSGCCAWFNPIQLRNNRDITAGDGLACGEPNMYNWRKLIKQQANIQLLELDEGQWDGTEKTATKEMQDNYVRRRGPKEAARRHACCQDEESTSIGDCDSFGWPKGPAMDRMLELADDNEVFYTHFLEAWNIATENGWDLSPMQ